METKEVMELLYTFLVKHGAFFNYIEALSTRREGYSFSNVCEKCEEEFKFYLPDKKKKIHVALLNWPITWSETKEGWDYWYNLDGKWGKLIIKEYERRGRQE